MVAIFPTSATMGGGDKEVPVFPRSVLIGLIVAVSVTACAQVDRPGDLGEDYRLSKVIEKAFRDGDCDRALGLVRDAGQSGDHVSLLLLGYIYEGGMCVDQDLEEAFRIYQRLAMTGEDDGMLLLGYFYLKGLGVEKNEGQARKWFRKVAFKKAGYSSTEIAENLFSYTFLYRGTPQGTVRNFFVPETDEWLKKIIPHSVEVGLSNTPKEVLQEFQSARMLFKSGPRVRYEVSRKLRHGIGVPKDIDVANKWLRSAARDGLKEALFDEAVMELDSADHKDNWSPWKLERLAKQGFVPAMMELYERFLLTGRKGKPDKVAAYYWLVRARDA
ncbi:MAG: tetratricopeptide repeat protein, partial [Rhodospirillales bacterium]